MKSVIASGKAKMESEMEERFTLCLYTLVNKVKAPMARIHT